MRETRTTQRWSRGAAMAATAVLLATACENATKPGEPATGDLAVEVATAGDFPDADGYEILLDEDAGGTIGADATATLSGIDSGDHLVTLQGVASNCAVATENPRMVTVVGGRTTTVSFDVVCATPTGSVRVTITTSGATPDPDGYLLVLDGAGSKPTPVAGAVMFDALTLGSHSVELRDVESNCLVAGPNPTAVMVEADSLTLTMFNVECAYVPRQIAFVSDRDSQPGGAGAEIFLMGTDGASPAPLVTSAGWDAEPAWSPGGGRIAFSREGDWFDVDVYAVAPDGSQLTRLTSSGANLQPDWSPDGSRIAFASWDFGDTNIAVMDESGANPVQFTSAGIDAEPAWSPDGARIAFVSDRDGDPEIYVMDADGSNPRRLTDSPGLEAGPAWSPDGTRIAFASERDGDSEIYVMDADGSKPRRLTNSPGLDAEPAWSPDGARIAFTSGRDGNREIYVMNADGSAPTNISRNPAEDYQPAWAW